MFFLLPFKLSLLYCMNHIDDGPGKSGKEGVIVRMSERAWKSQRAYLKYFFMLGKIKVFFVATALYHVVTNHL